ncbi:Profilin/allergen [Trematosphaeria pertusa]|uniref:Profilin n=1 Tax=Trematosphaeria pertusa TaxID=390896 RepID=A0A6A6I297_9PLEO|nr:Profilin/allergen [Trematosphaeria pertusa]KAF2244092.1 Profilin/allergen [Trematosphaeria pertusa]
MSWQAYIDQSLLGPGNIDRAMICDAAGSAVWATSPGFSVTDAERQAIASSFTDASDPKQVISNGIKIGGEKYMTIEAGDDELKAKKGKEGIVCVKTTQALLICHHNADTQTTVAFNDAAALGEYLKKMGY